MDDCLVIGGGVIGLAIAYQLAGDGLQVSVIDRDTSGRSASWAGAGILPPARRDKARDAWEELCGWSIELHPQWAQQLREETKIDTGFRRCGGIYLARSPGEAASLAVAAEEARELGIEVEPLDNRQLAEREPLLEPLALSGDVKTAFAMPAESQIRNPRYLKALLAACAARGVSILDHVEAIGFSSSMEVVETTAGPMKARNVCITGGAWTAPLLAKLGFQIAMEPWRGQVVLLRCKTPPIRHIVNEGYRYLVCREDGHMLVGSTVEDVGFDDETTKEGIEGLLQFADEMLPSLEIGSTSSTVEIEATWAGLRPQTGDGRPYLGRIGSFENAFVAAGHFRSGLTTSPGTAVVMSQLIRGETPEIDLTMFRLGR